MKQRWKDLVPVCLAAKSDTAANAAFDQVLDMVGKCFTDPRDLIECELMFAWLSKPANMKRIYPLLLVGIIGSTRPVRKHLTHWQDARDGAEKVISTFGSDVLGSDVARKLCEMMDMEKDDDEAPH